jgi:hypothetical protein
MSNDGVLAAHDPGIVAALVKHTFIGSDDVREVDSPVQGALIGTDHNDMFLVHMKIVH